MQVTGDAQAQYQAASHAAPLPPGQHLRVVWRRHAVQQPSDLSAQVGHSDKLQAGGKGKRSRHKSLISPSEELANSRRGQSRWQQRCFKVPPLLQAWLTFLSRFLGIT